MERVSEVALLDIAARLRELHDLVEDLVGGTEDFEEPADGVVRVDAREGGV